MNGTTITGSPPTAGKNTADKSNDGEDTDCNGDNGEETGSPWWVRGYVQEPYKRRMARKVLKEAAYSAMIASLVIFCGYTIATGMEGADAVAVFTLMGVMAIVADPPGYLIAWVFDETI